MSNNGTTRTSTGGGVGLKKSSSRGGADNDVSSGPNSESYRESSVESISTTTSTLSECDRATSSSILPLSTSSLGTDATKDMISSSFSLSHGQSQLSLDGLWWYAAVTGWGREVVIILLECQKDKKWANDVRTINCWWMMIKSSLLCSLGWLNFKILLILRGS